MSTPRPEKIRFLVSARPGGGYRACGLAHDLLIVGQSLRELRQFAAAVVWARFGAAAVPALLIGAQAATAREPRHPPMRAAANDVDPSLAPSLHARA